MGPANCEALVEADLGGPAALWLSDADRLGAVLGPKTGAALYKALRARVPTVPEMTLMLASSTMPRGVGESKLKSLFAVAPDWRTWREVAGPPAGWTAASLRAFQEGLAAYETWRATELAWLSAPVNAPVVETSPKGVTRGLICSTGATPVANGSAGTICFTGFRDKALEADAVAAGFSVAAALTSKVTILVTPDGAVATEKVKKAAATGRTEILGRSAFILKYLGNN